MKWGYLNGSLIRIPVKIVRCGYYLRWYYNGWHYWNFIPGKVSIETEGEKYRTVNSRKVTMSSGQIFGEQCEAIRTIMNTREIYFYSEDGWMNVKIEPGTFVVYDNQINGYEIIPSATTGSRESPVEIVFTIVYFVLQTEAGCNILTESGGNILV